MSREIKFRAWFDGLRVMDAVSIGHRGVMSSYIYHDELIMLMQFTGLRDKNGNDIYEGDIVQHDKLGDVAIIRWSDEKCGFTWSAVDETYYTDRQMISEDLEVVGNIYENPELIGLG